MAGSYRHIVDEDGKLLDNEEFVSMIENLGDAYEMTQEMYGMIWFLATRSGYIAEGKTPAEAVEFARQSYKSGILNFSPGIRNDQKIF